MIDVTHKLLSSWHALLNQQINIDGLNIPVYRFDVPVKITGHCIVLRAESETDSSNNASVVTNPVIITEVITRFIGMIEDSVAITINSVIKQKLSPTWPQIALANQAQIQIVNVTASDAQHLTEDDGTYKYYRIVTRYIHRIVQQ